MISAVSMKYLLTYLVTYLRRLSFYGLISAVKSLRTDSNFQDLQNTDHEYEPLTTRILQAKKATILIYKKLISNKSSTPESSQKK